MRAATSLHLVPPAKTKSESRPESFTGPEGRQPVGRQPVGRQPVGRQPVGRRPLGREPLWREVVGARLRHLRRRRALTLVEVAARAGISPQYLSEVERGRKDPSSEVLAAITGALDEQLVELTQ